ncbi:MAG: hypothetical protein U5K51_17690 [Flavobacteriaceae bacterium]|nr:hypothetical protein [Flavobacteriaceae bacterium]
MKTLLMFMVLTGFITSSQAQLLKKMKDKANQLVDKAEEKVLGGFGDSTNGQPTAENAGAGNSNKR